MEQKFLIKDGYPLLTLFFSGWGGEECLFAGYRPSGSDFLLCCDYRNLDFDPSLLEGYRGIKVVAWSLGVWVAGHVLQGKEAGFTEMIAVNGTPVPVDDRYGIPEQIFKGTLEHMDDTVLKKFRRRMCGTAEGLQAFMAHHPSRQAEGLKDELACLYEAVKSTSGSGAVSGWTCAFVGARDRIFPAASQTAAWDGKVPVHVFDEEHYSERLFRMALESPAGAWSGNTDFYGK